MPHTVKLENGNIAIETDTLHIYIEDQSRHNPRVRTTIITITGKEPLTEFRPIKEVTYQGKKEFRIVGEI